MKRAMLTTTFAALGLTLFATAQIQANGPHSNGAGHQTAGSNHQGAMNGRNGEAVHSFKANGRFDYGRHGFKSLCWTRYGWSDRYHNYLYWAPGCGWCFYEPTYTSYLPIAYYQEVYPQATLVAAPAVAQAPSVIQQTTVAIAAPPAPIVDLPRPPLAPLVAPAPGAVQQTKVNAGVP